MFGVLFLFIVLAISLLAYFEYKSEIRECNDYRTYGYVTEVNGNYWDNFNGRDICLITMEDRTKLPLNDFKTMSIKNPLTTIN